MSEFKEKIVDVLKQKDVRVFGFCSFEKVRDELIECRAKGRLPENAQTIIICAFPYMVEVIERNVSRYAVVKDYHKVVMSILNDVVSELKTFFPENSFSAFVDNSPIPEVKTAALAGLGVVGENGLLITEEFGSWVFIGEIVTDLFIECEERKINSCIKCGKCKKVCPAKNECISAVSQKKGELSSEEERLLKENNIVWGCDICQEVCPLNKNKPSTYIEEFLNDAMPVIKIGDYDLLKDRAFQWRPKSVIERNLILNYK